MEVRRGLKGRTGTAPMVLAALLGVATLATFVVTRHAEAAPNRRNAELAAAAQANAIGAQLEAHSALLGAAAQALGGTATSSADLSRLAPAEAGAALASVRLVDGRPAIGRVVSPANRTAAALNGLSFDQPEWRLALEQARDDGDTVVTTGPGASGELWVLEAQALYGTGEAPAQVADRRARLAGYVIVFEPSTSLAGLTADQLGVQLTGRVVEGTVVLNTYGRQSAERGQPSIAPVTTDEADWVVQVWPRRTPSKLPWFVLAGGLLLTVAVLLVAVRAERKSAASAAVAAERASELGLIARSGQLLQRSLDVAELVPLFVVEVSDELGLEGMAISLVATSGELVGVFSLGGDAGDRDGAGLEDAATARGTMPVPPGGTVVIALQRAGRVIGRLSARAPRGLSATQHGALRAAGDLLAAALGNARLLQSEQDMVARLRDLDRLKTTFIGSVSHELRTTVTAIEGFTDLLAEDMADAENPPGAEYMAPIQRNARSLRALVDDLLDFARLERSGLSVRIDVVNLSELVPRIVEQMSSILDRRPVELAVAPGVIADADPAAFERILVNLLSNAAKYTPAATPIQVGLVAAEGVAVLSVADHGPGIAVEERERIFDMFYRIDNESARVARGTGMGLALVRQLAVLLHGTVTADETPGGGARFRVTVPLHLPDPSADQSHPTHHASPV